MSSSLMDSNRSMMELPPHVSPVWRFVHPSSADGVPASVRRRRAVSRYEHFAQEFGIPLHFEEGVDRLMWLDDERSLESYLPTDSIWWTDRLRRFPEDPGLFTPPNPAACLDRAAAILQELGLAHAEHELGIDGIDISLGATSGPVGEPVQTALTCRFGTELDGIPVIGPGAKTYLTFVENADDLGVPQLVELLSFWRQVERGEEIPLIAPETAVAKALGDLRFHDLDASVPRDVLRAMLTYYAPGPHRLASELKPKYAVQIRVGIAGETGNSIALPRTTWVYVDAAES